MRTTGLPEPMVSAYILDDEGRLLLAKPLKGSPHRLSVPSGHVELGESAIEALKRTVYESTGMRIKATRLLAVHEDIFPEGYRGKRHFILLEFLCRPSGGHMRLSGKAAWVKPGDALKQKGIGATKQTLKLLSMKGYEPLIPSELERRLLKR